MGNLLLKGLNIVKLKKLSFLRLYQYKSMTLKCELDQLWFRRLCINSSREAGTEPQQTPSSLKPRLEPIKLTKREKRLQIRSSIFPSLSPHDSVHPADPQLPSLSLSLSLSHTHVPKTFLRSISLLSSSLSPFFSHHHIRLDGFTRTYLIVMHEP